MTLQDAIYQAALKQAREHQKAHPTVVGTYGSFVNTVFTKEELERKFVDTPRMIHPSELLGQL